MTETKRNKVKVNDYLLEEEEEEKDIYMDEEALRNCTGIAIVKDSIAIRGIDPDRYSWLFKNNKATKAFLSKYFNLTD